MTTLKDIAAEANVSVNTVSRVLNGKSKNVWPRVQKQAEEIQAIARRLNYVPNASARAMRTNQHRRVGFVIPGKYTAAVDFDIVMGAEDVLRKHGYSLSVICMGELDRWEDLLPGDSFDGLLVRHIRHDCREAIRALGGNCIWVDTNETGAFNCIRRDEVQAGKTAAASALNLGYRRIIYVEQVYRDTSENQHYHAADRLAGVAEVTEAAAGVQFQVLKLPRDNRFEQLEAVLDGISVDTALIAADVLVAEEVTFFSVNRGLCAGRDFALISCDEQQGTRQVWPGLSRVMFNRVGMGRQAAEMLLSLMLNKKKKMPSISLLSEWCDGVTAASCCK